MRIKRYLPWLIERRRGLVLRWLGRLFWLDGYRVRSLRSWPHIPLFVQFQRAIARNQDAFVESVMKHNALLAHLSKANR